MEGLSDPAPVLDGGGVAADVGSVSRSTGLSGSCCSSTGGGVGTSPVDRSGPPGDSPAGAPGQFQMRGGSQVLLTP